MSTVLNVKKVEMSLKKPSEVLTDEEEISYLSDSSKVVPVNKQQFKQYITLMISTPDFE